MRPLPDGTRAVTPLDELCSVLWHERELMEQLVYRLEGEQLTLGTGRDRFLGRAAQDVEDVLDAIRASELPRAVVVQAVVEQLGIDPDPSLRTIAEAAPEPWGALLSEHHTAMTEVVGEIAALAEGNRELLSAGLHAVRVRLDGARRGDESPTYGSDGTTHAAAPRRATVDRSI